MKFSIIMTSYNYSQYIAEAIESVLNQTFEDWELIIVDDGSSDNSVDIVNSYVNKDSRIRFFTHENNANRGLAESLRLGVREAKADWITFLESDDLFLENSLEVRAKVIEENPCVDFIYYLPEVIGEEPRKSKLETFLEMAYKPYFNQNVSGVQECFKEMLPRLNPVPTFSVAMVKKDLLEKCSFNSLIQSSLDYYLWSQIANYNVYYLNKSLTFWRAHNGSFAAREKVSFFKSYIFKILVFYNTIRDKNIMKRLFLLLNYMRKRLFYIKLSKNIVKINVADIFIKELKAR